MAGEHDGHDGQDPRSDEWRPQGSDAAAKGGPWRTTVARRDVTLVVTSGGWRARYELLVDDGSSLHRAEKTTSDHRFSIRAGDVRVEVRCGGMGAVRRATAHVEGVCLDLDAPPGSRAARLQELARSNPRAYAVRHVASGVASVVWFVLGAALVARLLAWLRSLIDVDLPRPPLPDGDLPRIPWPDIDLPDLPRLSWTPPAWLVTLLDSKEYWWPILLGVALATWEVRRQRVQARVRAEQARQQHEREQQAQERVLTEQQTGDERHVAEAEPEQEQ